jgi:hypothetical protein
LTARKPNNKPTASPKNNPIKTIKDTTPNIYVSPERFIDSIEALSWELGVGSWELRVGRSRVFVLKIHNS